MQRLTAFITLIAFFLTMSMPVLAIPPVCKHAIDDGNYATNIDDCHGEHPIPDSISLDADMDMSTMVMIAEELDQDAVQSTANTPSYGDCVIACGCGCHSDPDSFPQTLPPHLPITYFHHDNITSIRQALPFHVVQTTLFTSPDNPPPKNN